MTEPFKGKCFNCDKEGHLARNCPSPKRARINTFSAAEWATFEEEFQGPPPGQREDHISASIHAFTDLSLEEKGQFMSRMNDESTEDFQKAWSVWPWSGQLAQIVYTCRIISLFQYEYFSTRRAKGLKQPHSWTREQQKTLSMNDMQGGCASRSKDSLCWGKSTMWMVPQTNKGTSNSSQIWKYRWAKNAKAWDSSSPT
jgi:hypothetical protein